MPDISEIRPILCTRCNVAIESRSNPNGEKIGFCPSCGESNTLENIKREAMESVAYFVEKKMHDMLSDTVRGSGALTLTPNHFTERSFRFIVQME